jgi:S-formylglutathione hydrolase FrmB
MRKIYVFFVLCLVIVFMSIGSLPVKADVGDSGLNTQALDACISRQVNEMIIMIAGSNSKMGGSFYVNSPVTENWEDYIVSDLVGYADEHFQTLPQAESRGITGHSMGGFGALNIFLSYDEFVRIDERSL